MKRNKEARKALQRAYNNLARSIDAIADLEAIFDKDLDMRYFKAEKAAGLIMKAQEVLNPMAEDEDIGLI